MLGLFRSIPVSFNAVVQIKLLQLILCQRSSICVYGNRQFHSSSQTLHTSFKKPTQQSTMYNSNVVLKEFLKVVPPLTFDRHKGEAGRIGVIGGSEEYTGAPYFAAITILKVGADLSHVLCPSAASPVIKSYSPELIVHPLLDKENGVESIKEWLPRLHAVAIGPGLGRVASVMQVVKEIIAELRRLDTPIVIDADGLFLVTQEPEIIRGYNKVILTPNVVEFGRLLKALNITCEETTLEPNTKSISETVALSKALGDVTVVRKGRSDIIAKGEKVVTVDEEGSPRRCGGQGDLLSGAMTVFSYWANKRHGETNIEPEILASYAACLLTRKCAQQAYSQHKRSTTTTDLITEIDSAFRALFELDKCAL